MKTEITISNKAALFGIDLIKEYLLKGGKLDGYDEPCDELAMNLLQALEQADRIVIEAPKDEA